MFNPSFQSPFTALLKDSFISFAIQLKKNRICLKFRSTKKCQVISNISALYLVIAMSILFVHLFHDDTDGTQYATSYKLQDITSIIYDL